MHCDAFHETALAVLDGGRPLVLDLSGCEYMDSTCLGTVHELVARGGVVLAGVTPAVRALFEELSMQQVLAAIRDDIPAAPELYALGTERGQAAVQKRILQAHEALSALSEHNREEFKEVVESLRSEAGRAEMTAAIRVLHLEDDPADAQRIRDRLQDEEDFACDIVWVQTREDFLSALQEQPFDLVLFDYQDGGLDMLRQVRQQQPELLLIVISDGLDRGRGGGLHEGRRHGLRPQAAVAAAGFLGAASARRTGAESGTAPGGRRPA